MSRTKYLILLLSLASLLSSCGYSFMLKGGGNLGSVNLLKCSNLTPLRSASLMLDEHMENVLSSYGLYSTQDGRPKLRCIVVSTSKSQVTSNQLGYSNLYRLTVTVKAELYDKDDKKLWEAQYSDDGEYSSGGQEEDGLDVAFDKIAIRISQSLSAIKVKDAGTS
jgi:outer membrane lipopolysaccharide assembly protein LptE/RlpB